MAVEHSLVQLAAGATRALVIDQRAVIEVLLAGRHVEPVQRALAPLRGEKCPHLVSRQRRPQGDRMRGEAAVPAVVYLNERDVEGARALLLQLGVFEAGALAPHPPRGGGWQGDVLAAAGDEPQRDGAVPGRTSGQTVELLQGWPLKPSIRRKLELQLSERSKAGVLPLFVLRGGKAQLSEAGEGRLAKGADRPVCEPCEASAQGVSETRHGDASR